MENTGSKQQETLSISPWRSLILIVIYFFIGMFVGQFLGALLAMMIFGLGFEQTLEIASNFQEEPNGKYVLYCLQFGSAVGAFIVAPLIYLYRTEKSSLAIFFNEKSRHIIPLSLTVFVTLSFMMVNSLLIEWNAEISFPESLEWLEEVFQEQESQMRQLTEYLTQFGSFQDFLIAFLIIAILPAVGEELLFRGLIQTQLGRALRSPHAAIWFTAFLFGAIHFQFYGLLPRVFLGAIFGYLYYWSGSLLLPMLGHFINNGFSLIMYYLYQEQAIEYNMEESAALPYSYILVFLLLGVAGFWYFRRFFRQQATEENNG